VALSSRIPSPVGSACLSAEYRPALGRRRDDPVTVHFYVELAAPQFQDEQYPLPRSALKPCLQSNQRTFGDPDGISDTHREASDDSDENAIVPRCSAQTIPKLKIHESY
jgi:hypothetical protein